MDNRSKQAANQDEIHKQKQHYEQRLQKVNLELQERDLQLEKARSQNAEITRELVESTNESG